MRRNSVDAPPHPFRVRATAALFLPLTLAILAGCAARPVVTRQAADDASLLRAVDAVRLWRPSLEESAIASDEVVIHFDSGKDGLSPTAAKKLDLAAQLRPRCSSRAMPTAAARNGRTFCFPPSVPLS
jgi:hypothetical protein